MAPRVPQPPIDPARRAREQHGFWLPFLMVLAALGLGTVGVVRATRVPTKTGGPATEVQLMAAFAHGGLHRVRPAAPPDPMQLRDPAALALAMERWRREQAQAAGRRFLVDLAAKDPCPT